MIGTDTISRVIGQDVYDESGEKIGSAAEVYLDDEVLLGLDLGDRLLHGARMDEVVVRRTGRHFPTLSTVSGEKAEDAPGHPRDTPGHTDHCAP